MFTLVDSTCLTLALRMTQASLICGPQINATPPPLPCFIGPSASTQNVTKHMFLEKLYAFDGNSFFCKLLKDTRTMTND